MSGAKPAADATVEGSSWPLLIVGLGTLVVPLDSAVNVGFPAIVERFALSIPMIQWTVISYVLTQTCLLLTFGRVADMLGYRRVFLVGTFWSTLAFLACALAPTYPMLLAGRVAQGVGAGLILSCGPALATSLFDEKFRARALGRYMMMFAIGGALGPAVFGPLVQWFGWSAVFSVRVPVALVAFLLAWALPPDPKVERREAFDATGGVLLAGTLGCALLALNRLGDLPRGAPWLALFAGMAMVGGRMFYRRELCFARPIIDVSYFRNARFTGINAAFALVNLAAFSVMLLVPFYLSQIPGLSISISGLILAASPFGSILGAPLAGWFATTGSPRAVAMVGMFLCAVGLAAVSLAGSTLGSGALIVSLAVQGFGIGLLQVAYFDIVTAAIPLHNRGVAGALAMVTRSIGTVTGATVIMLLFQTLRGSGGQQAANLVPAFRQTLLLAASIPATLAFIGLRLPAIMKKASGSETGCPDH